MARCLDEQYVTAVSPTKDADADVTMLGKKRLQNRKCEILAENEEGTVGEARSHAEVAAL